MSAAASRCAVAGRDTDGMAGNLTEFAAEQQGRFDSSTSPRERKERGHFGTPAAIADFMASMFSAIPQGTVRVLDPGAGVGTLSAAVCQRVLRQSARRRLEFELWENDPKLAPYLRRTMDQCSKALRGAGHRVEYAIYADDFVLANGRIGSVGNGHAGRFHIAILNPPYYKLRKDSPQALAMEHVVHGQPNIYALFMAVAGEMLLPGGELVAITPRSYFNGPYFKRFRTWFFDRHVARKIHVFESRAEAFRDDDVLQENVILLAEKGGKPSDIIITSGAGREFRDIGRRALPYTRVIEDSSGDRIVRVPSTDIENETVEAMDRLPKCFRSLGFEISTGPVVAFRSTEFLREQRTAHTAPLLWMHNVRPFLVQFPPNNGKPTHIVVSDESKRLLVPARRYILLKRFTAKEEHRRLVAAVMEPTDSYSKWVGLENHLNYVYRSGGGLSDVEAFGLAAFFNSALVDRYFRAVSGNTQVNAAEVRAMPLPDEATLCAIGKRVRCESTPEAKTVERIVGRALGLGERLIDKLCELSK